MKAKEYNVVEMAVRAGVEYGYNRAHKHTDSPSEETIKEAMCEAIMAEMCEWFIFEVLTKEYGQ